MENSVRFMIASIIRLSSFASIRAKMNLSHSKMNVAMCQCANYEFANFEYFYIFLMNYIYLFDFFDEKLTIYFSAINKLMFLLTKSQTSLCLDIDFTYPP